MNKINAILIVGFFIVGITSCTPESLLDENTSPQACCGENLPIPPPPPTGGN